MRLFMGIAVTGLLLSSLAANAGVPAENIDEYGRGIISDYSDMAQGEDIEWLWIKPGLKLSDYRYQVDSSENLTLLSDEDMESVLSEGLPKVLKRAGSRNEQASLLHVDTAVYWAERANSSKAWIPFAGGHAMQAGVGIELVFKDEAGSVVAKIRQSGREGADLERAAQELVDDIAKFIHSH